MTVRHDRSYLRATDGEFISRGYAEDGISSVNIRFEYSEEQKHKNVRSGKLMTPAQWTACCVVEPQKRSAYIFPVMDAIAKSFVCTIKRTVRSTTAQIGNCFSGAEISPCHTVEDSTAETIPISGSASMSAMRHRVTKKSASGFCCS